MRIRMEFCVCLAIFALHFDCAPLFMTGSDNKHRPETNENDDRTKFIYLFYVRIQIDFMDEHYVT